MLDQLLTSSSLVRDLVHVFEQLVEGFPVSIRLNQHIAVGFDLAPDDAPPPNIQPFHTLLLMDKPEAIVSEMKHLASPLLVNIVHSLTIRRK